MHHQSYADEKLKSIGYPICIACPFIGIVSLIGYTATKIKLRYNKKKKKTCVTAFYNIYHLKQ
ncbi:hypothetical protein CHF27_010990 [Romboutsia maritimum]|uniref:Uncharacterized protein n=1 Tax=Romboutsia maritimum TaxID=2020948 RepID=A0A371IR27_9FIRM|nr:hypothetical protein CHF27_010990 [Romboutsia maritimum]